MAKTAVLEIQGSPKLISRKIWMTEKSWNFYTVFQCMYILQSWGPFTKLGLQKPYLVSKCSVVDSCEIGCTQGRKSFDPKLSSPVISEMDTTIVIANIFRWNEDGNGAQRSDGSRFTLTTINTTKLGMIRITISVRKKNSTLTWS